MPGVSARGELAVVASESLPIRLKTATEYPLPANGPTHEIVSPVPGLLLVSPQPDSRLIKIAVDPETGRPLEAAKHTIGTQFSGLSR